ncbi:hypothetical protein CQW23_31007 [Capsicum baccatum]|uniref:Uncharacterized protein n=1 Tax=Capsicum baccatum TaxID=33114 RepID=A0A2G2V922_CAPBA|nr:hypothetical protein CQW23_31007 [Capsicum baccatum]
MGDFVELACATAGKKGFGHMATRYILGTGLVEWNIKGFVEGSNGGEEYMELGCRLGLGIGDRGEVVFWDRNGFQLRQSPHPLSSFYLQMCQIHLESLV